MLCTCLRVCTQMALLRSALLGQGTAEVQTDRVSDDNMVCEAQLGYDGLPAKDAKAIQDDFRYKYAYCCFFMINMFSYSYCTFDTFFNVILCVDHASMKLHTVTL